MITVPATANGPSLIMIEGAITLIAVVTAFCWPKLGSTYFSNVERLFTKLARKKPLAVAMVGSSALLLRLAILPFCPIPLPFIHDDFSFLLAADTFASGRLTNSTPVMWKHFETFHVTMKPTYMSMYFPAQGLVLAAGKALFGHPWYGELFITALMCAAICWMLQAWLPPTWALLGGMIAVIRLGLFSYWINTYTGGGSIAALGGALVLGAFPRFMKHVRIYDGVLLSLGVILLAYSRPFEGILLCLPVAVALMRWILFGKDGPDMCVLVRKAAVPLMMLVLAGAWMGYYDYHAFGNPFILPYKVNRATYSVAQHFIWQSLRPEPVYRYAVMRKFYTGWELNYFIKIKTLSGFLIETLRKLAIAIVFFSGIVFLPCILMLHHVFRDRRVRFLVFCFLILAFGMLLEIWFIPHYVAPFVVVFYAIGLQGMRHLRLWRPGRKPCGIALVRFTIAACVVLAALRVWAEPLHLELANWPSLYWFGSKDFGIPRAMVEKELEQMPGKQLVIVRYPPEHNPLYEWVFNAADIDNSKVIWARNMDEAGNRELIRYYKDRKVWLLEPDKNPAKISPYVDAVPTAVQQDRSEGN